MGSRVPVNRSVLIRLARIRIAGLVKVREAITAEALRQLGEQLKSKAVAA